jgi:hypothetical protein
MIISNGTHGEDRGEMTAATKLRLALAPTFNPPGTVVDCNYRPDDAFNYRKLCGYTNVQGRYINGAVDTCHKSVDSGTGRFIHMEQDWHVLRPYAQNWARLYQNEQASSIMTAFFDVLPGIAGP